MEPSLHGKVSWRFASGPEIQHMKSDGVGTLQLRAVDLRQRAERLRSQIGKTVEADLIDQLTKLADEYDLLADAIDQLDPDDEEA
jgi:hypothetical protein